MSAAVNQPSYENSLRAAYTNVLEKVRSFGTWLDNWLSQTRKDDETLSLAQVPKEYMQIGQNTIDQLHNISDADLSKNLLLSKQSIKDKITVFFKRSSSNLRKKVESEDDRAKLENISVNVYEIKALVILAYILLFAKAPRAKVSTDQQDFVDRNKLFLANNSHNLYYKATNHGKEHIQSLSIDDARCALDLLGLNAKELECEHLLTENKFQRESLLGRGAKHKVYRALKESQDRAWKLVDKILEIKGIK